MISYPQLNSLSFRLLYSSFLKYIYISSVYVCMPVCACACVRVCPAEVRGQLSVVTSLYHGWPGFNSGFQVWQQALSPREPSRWPSVTPAQMSSFFPHSVVVL